jgi:GWxTD domain-containing protein
VTAVLVVLASGAAAEAQVSGLEVALFRTLRGEELTLVDGVVEFEPWLVQGGEDCAYDMRLAVRDSGGTTILEDGWSAVLDCTGEQPAGGGVVVETFQFAIAPGRYRVQVSVEAAGQPETAHISSVDLVNLPEDARISDLILGREVGFIDTTAAAGEWTVRKGDIGIAADPFVVADREKSSLAYYLEVYRGESDSEGQVVGVIRRRQGEEVTRTRLATLERGAASRPVAGKLSLAGLPPGAYALDLRLELVDTAVTSSRDFAVAAAAVAVSSGRTPEGEQLYDYFSALSDDELVELFDPIEVWLGTAGYARTYRGLTPAGKRNFLADYFEHAAPSIVGDGESPLDMYLQRARFVMGNFSEKEGREERAGWRTDRGRIYMLRGQPDEWRLRSFPRDNAPPYEIWAYEVGQGFVYLFVDETKFNHYRLYYSTDPAEADYPGWQQRVGRVTLTELEQYTGFRVRLPS